MLVLSKDYLRKKAAAEYEAACNDAESQKALQQNQANWTRRLNEAPWLMKDYQPFQMLKRKKSLITILISIH